jgi:hypothetical protein
MSRAERRITDASSGIAAAARLLIGMVRGAERDEQGRSTHAELELEVDLTGGGKETWVITIERTASSH